MWPISQPSSEVKQLVNCFFTLVDTNSQEVGKTLADAIFTQDGVFITANGTFQGAAGKIRSSGAFPSNSKLLTQILAQRFRNPE